MTFKERMEKLDEIGFVGVQRKLTPKQEKALTKETGKIIAAMKKAEAAKKTRKAS